MRLNASQSQSYVLGGGDKGGELPRFERPVLKQAKSAYTAATSPRVPPKSSLSSGFFRGRSSNGLGLGNGSSNSNEHLPLTNSPPSEVVKARSKVRAALSGREGGQGLPDWSRSAPSPSNSFERQNRGRSTSQEYLHAHTQLVEQYEYEYDSDDEQTQTVKQRRSGGSSSHNVNVNHHETQAPSSSSSSHVLRQRKGTPDDYHPRPPRQTNSGGGESPYRPPSRKLRNPFLFRRPCHKWSISHILQASVTLLLTFLLYDGHHKANLIANRLKEFKSEEAMLFLHLHRIEQQSIQLHEALQRLDFKNPQDPHQQPSDPKPPDSAGSNSEYLQDARHGHPNNAPIMGIDSALIQKQTQQLMQMEEELSHEVRTLQTRIQHSAVRSIVHEYGEGPVQVIWEVMVDGQTSKISILLWHDTPHAAWTWLEQISQKLWDGAQVHLENNRILGVGSIHSQVSQDAKLDFIERSQQRHEAWTVGLADATHDGTNAGLQVFINLQDNTEFSKHNVCIGKVFDGFDVLHKMVEQTRQMQLVAGGQQPPPHPITIKTARASHLTNRETKGLI